VKAPGTSPQPAESRPYCKDEKPEVPTRCFLLSFACFYAFKLSWLEFLGKMKKTDFPVCGHPLKAGFPGTFIVVARVRRQIKKAFAKRYQIDYAILDSPLIEVYLCAFHGAHTAPESNRIVPL
jgi:hypothetical protein